MKITVFEMKFSWLALINLSLTLLYKMGEAYTAHNTVLVHVIMIIRDSSTAANEEKEWINIQQQYFKNFTGYNNVIINIHLTRIRLDYGNGYNPVGGTWYIMSKIQKFIHLYHHAPAYLISNSINQEMALLATDLKIPLIGCSQEYDIPSGLVSHFPLLLFPG